MKLSMLRIMTTVGAVLIGSCQSESSGGGGGGGGGATTTTDENKTVSYDKEISSLLKTYCVSCHGSTSPDLSTYAAAKAGAKASLASIKDGSMPPKGSKQMTASAIKQFEAWVKNGTKRSASASSTSNDTTGSNNSSAITYNGWVASYLTEQCVSCHSNQMKKGNVDLSTYALAKTHAESSYGTMKGGTMPPGSAPSSDIVKKMKSWIDAGMPKEDSSQGQDQDQDQDSGSNLTWESNIKSWMQTNCNSSGCHSSSSKAGGYDLSTLSKVKASSSKVMDSINNDRMPISNPVSQEDRAMLEKWIEAAMP